MDIPLQITFRNLDTSPAVEALIHERVDRLSRYHPHIIAVRATVQVPHRGADSGKTALSIALEADVPGTTLVARGESEMREHQDDRLSFISRAFEALQRRLAADAAIKRGAVKVHEGEGETGRVARLFPARGHGFIEINGGPDLYFTRNAVVSGSFETLAEGSLVEITRATTEGPMGPQASSVRPFGAATAGSH